MTEVELNMTFSKPFAIVSLINWSISHRETIMYNVICRSQQESIVKEASRKLSQVSHNNNENCYAQYKARVKTLLVYLNITEQTHF